MGEIKNIGLTGNTLKIIAAISMVIDHIGILFFPDIQILRYIGRISFPIFAFMIAEGCEYTKNKLRYFLTIFLLGVFCQIVYYFYGNSTDMCILITFSISILVIYSMQFFKKSILEGKISKICISAVILISAIWIVYILNSVFYIDYKFFGCMTPVFASILRKPSSTKLELWNKIDTPINNVILLGICLVFLAFSSTPRQFFALLALPLLLLYSGKKGTLNMKYFFYIFYPAHLAILQGLAYLIC